MLFLVIALGVGAVVTLLWLWTLARSPLVFVPNAADIAPGVLVSLIIPMYNEERNVDTVLAAVRAQTHAPLEVIAVDDRSSDGTAAKLAEWQASWPELRVVSIAHHPDEWWGKSYPMCRGAQVATGEWLLFLDADIRLAPGSVAGTVGACHARGWDALGILGRLRFSTFWARVLHVNFATLYLILVSEAPQAMMCGHYMLVRRRIYEATGGWAMVFDEMQDDVALPRLLSENGYTPRMRVWLGSHEVAEYRDLPEVWRATRRQFAGGLGFHPAKGWFPALGGALTRLGPWAVLIAGVFGKWWTHREGAIVMGLAAACALFLMASYFRLTAILGAGPWIALTRPLGDLMAFALQVDALVRSAFGSLEWKGLAFRRQRGFPERPDDLADLIDFYRAAAARGVTAAWVERLALQNERINLLFTVLDQRPLSANVLARIQPLMTVAHAARLTLRHGRTIRGELRESGLARGGEWLLVVLVYGWQLAQLAFWAPGWLRWVARRYGVMPRFAELAPEEQRKVRAEAFLCLEQQYRPWFRATPAERRQGITAAGASASAEAPAASASSAAH